MVETESLLPGEHFDGNTCINCNVGTGNKTGHGHRQQAIDTEMIWMHNRGYGRSCSNESKELEHVQKSWNFLRAGTGSGSDHG
jgi:hypothetical protein